MVRGDKKGKIGPLPTGLIIVIALSILAVGILQSGGGEVSKPEPPLQNEAVSRTFRIDVWGEILRYKEVYIWSENNYRKITENWTGFKKLQIQYFKEIYNTEPKFYTIRHNDFEWATFLESEIHEHITENEGKYTANLNWFLDSHGLNLIENNFKATKTGLTWQGELNKVPTGIIIDLPPQKTKYSEWGERTGHNHSKVWWPENAQK